uniref:2oxoglutarate and irondependent oxygenase domaincontaining protein 3like [Bombyx mori] n=1 Tax=Lepeophtheirus salmonis TaxID=72036 RepID=A0A0K2UB86_LEPSM
MTTLRQRKSTESGPFSGRFNPKLGKKADFTPKSSEGKPLISHIWWSRIVMMASVLIVAYWSNSKTTVTIMAKRSENLTNKRYQNILCHPSYKNEISNTLQNPKCVPYKCGRVVMDDIIPSDTAYNLLQIAKKGFALSESSGGASILDLHSGTISKGEHFINLYANHPDVFSPEEYALYASVKNAVKEEVAKHFQIDSESLYLSYPTFFSRITAKPALTLHDEYWHSHIDKDTYPSFHYTSLLYLTDFEDDFRGGNFVFIDDKLNRTIEPKFGRVSIFTSGMENKHHVEPVTEGVRFALTMGFTCDKSKAIADPGTNSEK